MEINDKIDIIERNDYIINRLKNIYITQCEKDQLLAELSNNNDAFRNEVVTDKDDMCIVIACESLALANGEQQEIKTNITGLDFNNSSFNMMGKYRISDVLIRIEDSSEGIKVIASNHAPSCFGFTFCSISRGEKLGIFMSKQKNMSLKNRGNYENN